MHRSVLTGVVCRVIARTSEGQPSRSKRRVRLHMDKKQVSIPRTSSALLLSEIRLNQAFCRLWLSRATAREYSCQKASELNLQRRRFCALNEQIHESSKGIDRKTNSLDKMGMRFMPKARANVWSSRSL